jgi:hypothetical protein
VQKRKLGESGLEFLRLVMVAWDCRPLMAQRYRLKTASG